MSLAIHSLQVGTYYYTCMATLHAQLPRSDYVFSPFFVQLGKNILQAAGGKLAIMFLLAILLLCSPALITAQSVRYLGENGSDSGACLTDITGEKPCRTLAYALGDETLVNFELRVFAGTYEYGENETATTGFANFSIRSVPGSSGDVVFRCSSFSNEQFNDLSLYNGTNFSIHGITVQECGQMSAGIFIENTDGVFVSNCTFR